eukprot:3337945-Pleurochrysis_carterae.AAC.1
MAMMMLTMMMMIPFAMVMMTFATMMMMVAMAVVMFAMAVMILVATPARACRSVSGSDEAQCSSRQPQLTRSSTMAVR